MSRQYQILNFGKLIRIDGVGNRCVAFGGRCVARTKKPCPDVTLGAISVELTEA